MREPETKLPWKSSVCSQGEKCWCRIIESVDNVNDELEGCVATSGCISTQDAEYIVEACNNYPKLVNFIKGLISNELDRDTMVRLITLQLNKLDNERTSE